ncbi:MAG: hypothetical protein MUF53_03440 [Gemmatimonadaceae bacterium]|jgi:hypothetical protein|nr:hypothetical protein [Gemmatimonadaceae bacterium]
MDSGSDAAQARWLATAERIQRGLNHDLSNRTAALAAVVAVLDGPDPDLIGRLAEEVARLEALLRLKRLLPRIPNAPAEPVMADDLVGDVLALLTHVADLRDRPLQAAPLAGVPPLRCRPQALQHALLLLLVAVGDAGMPVTLDVSHDDAAVTFGIGASAGTPREAPGTADATAAAAAFLLAEDGALVWPEAGGYRLRLPTLTALRARARVQAPPG